MSDTGELADPRQGDSLRPPTKPDDGGPWHGQPAPREIDAGLASDSGTAGSQPSLGSTSSATWQRLIEAARNGCREAQTALFAAVRHQLVMLADQKMDPRFQSKIDGSDMVQETLVEAACGMAAFRGNSRAELVGWLRGILVHRMAGAQRHYGGVQKRCVDLEMPLGNAPAIFTDDTSPSGQAMRQESYERLDQALRQLPEPYEHILRLRNQLDLTFDEVATALGCSRDAASKRWARALRCLQLEFDHDDSP